MSGCFYSWSGRQPHLPGQNRPDPGQNDRQDQTWQLRKAKTSLISLILVLGMLPFPTIIDAVFWAAGMGQGRASSHEPPLVGLQ